MAEVKLDQKKKGKVDKRAVLSKGLMGGAFNHVPLIGGLAALIGGTANKLNNNQRSNNRMVERQDLGRQPIQIDPMTNRAVPRERMKSVGRMDERDPMQDLLDELRKGYSGTMPGYDDTEARAALSAALDATLSGINGLRETTNRNFTESDQNLKSMHSAFQNDIATNGAASFNQIADQHKGNLNANRDESVGVLTQLEDDSRNKRAAMLQSLGIQESAPADTGNELQAAQGSIVNRTNADVTAADNTRQANLAYNTGNAQAVGMQGMQRRSELQRQLNEAMGTINAKEMDARSAYQGQLAQLGMQKAGNQNNLAQFEYGMYRDEQDGVRGLLDQLLSQQGEAQEAPVIKGYAGLAQDLINSGVDQRLASQAMQSHATIVASEDYQKMKNRGQDPTPYVLRAMQEQGVPPAVAIQFVTNYGNLGNTSGFAALG